MMTYEQALAFIHGTLKLGSKLGLENIKILLSFMGDPHTKLKYIHVAGTNGKGSTTAMIASILKQQGYKVGMYTSPYIEEFTERIQIDGSPIEKLDLARITAYVQENIKKMVDAGYNHPTEFEIVTAIAFQYYYEQNCDIVVLEVGLGGRFDATNIIDTPLISVITSISLDHMEYLGTTIEQIAFEKCGIIKPRGIVVVYPQQHPDALKVIQETARERNAQIVVADDTSVEIISDTLDGIEFTYKEDLYTMGLLGSHQVMNAITALAVIEAMNQYSTIHVPNKSIKKGFSAVQWPGRFEILRRDPLFIIDGAHNISGVNALKQSLKQYLGSTDYNITFIIGMLKDKEYEACIRELAPFAHRMIAAVPNNPRAVAAEELGAIMQKYCSNVCIEPNIENIIQIAALNNENAYGQCSDVICCCGSLYLIGAVRTLFVQK